ncbi:MAG: hypothetical protein HKM92_11140 [Arenibacter sp.]|nr:hypothetical protein [Arenibacter sp.]
MKYISLLLVVFVFVSCRTDRVSYEETGRFQLAAPIINVDSILFKETTKVTMSFGFPNSKIHYTLDGTEVDQVSAIYGDPIVLNQAATIKAKAFHHDFKSSEQVAAQVEKITHNISDASITIEPQPHANYPGLGAKGLVDMQKGSSQFRSGDKWLGFQADKTTITLDLAKELQLSLLKVSCLQNQGGWIFAPKKITVFSESGQIGEITLDDTAKKQENQLKIMVVPIVAGSYSKLKVVVTALNEIPEWHPGKGTLPWLFLDEILVE